MSAWVVVLVSGDRPDDTYTYGPVEDQQTAERFAAFLTKQVDPARAYELQSPLSEMLSWYGVSLAARPLDLLDLKAADADA